MTQLAGLSAALIALGALLIAAARRLNKTPKEN